MKDMTRLKETICHELDEYADRERLSMSDIEIIHKLSDTYKNMCKIEFLEDGGYSGADDEMYSRNGGRMGGGYSQRRRRDSRGRYSRDGGGGYSYADGKKELFEMLDEMSDGANEREREMIRRFREEMRNA